MKKSLVTYLIKILKKATPSLRTLKRLLIFVILLCLTIIIVGVIYLSKPRSLNAFNDTIAQQLLPANDRYHVSIEDSVIQVDSFTEPLLITLSGVKLNTADDNTVLSFRQIDVTADITSLLKGAFVPEDIIIHMPKLTLFRDLAGELRLQADNGRYLPASFLELPEGDGQNSRLPFDTLTIRNANLFIDDRYRDMKVQADGALFYMEQHRTRYDMTFDLPLSVNEQSVYLQGKAVHNLDKKLSTISLQLDDINPASICQLLGSCGDIPTLSMPLSGNIAVRLGQTQQPKEIAFDVSGKQGNLSQEGFFAEPITLNDFSAQGVVKDYGNDVTIRNFTLNSGKMSITGNANFQRKSDGDYFSLDATGTNVIINDLYRYWPEPLAPMSREWVTQSVRDGMVPTGTIAVRMKPDDFSADYISTESLDATIDVKNATIDYMKDFPKATAVNGTVHFTGTTIEAKTNSGTLLTGTGIPSARFFFSDLNADGTPMEIDLSLVAPAQDVITIISPPRFDFLQDLPIDTTNLSGSVSGAIKLAFDAFSGESEQSDKIDWDRVKYDVDASFTDLNNITYDQTFGIAGANGNFKANNTSIETAIRAFINNAATDFSFKQTYGKAAHYTINTMLNAGQLTQFGLPEQDTISGILAIKADVIERGKETDVNATIDMAQAEVKLDEIGYIKPELQPASLSIRSSKNDKGNLSINYDSTELKIQAHADVDFEKETLNSFTANRIRYGKSDIGLAYSDLPDGYRLDIKGPRLDLSQMDDEEEGEPFSFANFPAIQLSLNIGEVIMPKDHTLYSVNGHVHCNSVRCDSADLSASLKDNKQFRATIFRGATGRQFRLQCNDAGQLLRTFDLAEAIYGGELDIRGTYDDKKKGNPLDARLTITNFVEKDAPILGKILNLSSLTGLLDTLTGKGIAFNKLSSDFVLVDDVLSLKNLKMVGDSIGIVGKGDINIAKQTIDLEGSLAPAYILNSIVGKIPLIGEALTGGKGEGLFAVNFSVRGNSNDPDVIVNPLSALTPGFTRNIFNIFDAGDGQTTPSKPMLEDMSKSPSATKPTPEKQAEPDKKVQPITEPNQQPVVPTPVNPFGGEQEIRN